jgi:hypothetical protein
VEGTVGAVRPHPRRVDSLIRAASLRVCSPRRIARSRDGRTKFRCGFATFGTSPMRTLFAERVRGRTRAEADRPCRARLGDGARRRSLRRAPVDARDRGDSARGAFRRRRTRGTREGVH